MIAFRTPFEKNSFSDKLIDKSEFSFEKKVQLELINLKSLVSRVAVHLPPNFRDFLFRQFDRLYDLDDWAEDDCFISEGSCSTFLKLICDVKPSKNPSLGVSDSGDLMASWRNEDSKLIVYSLKDDRIRWNLFVKDLDSAEQFAGQQNVRGFKVALAKHGFTF